MGNTVIIGRLSDKSDLNAIINGQTPTGNVEEFCHYNNYPLESYLEYLETPARIPNTTCFEIADVDAFLKEADQKMPRIFSEMDDLDHYCASKVLDDLPGVILSIWQATKVDKQTNRQSHYFIQFKPNA